MSKSASTKGIGRSTPTTPRDASRVQRAVAHANGGAVPKGSYVGDLQAAAARNFGKSGSK